MHIITASKSETVQYALSELKKYVKLITNCQIIPTSETLDELPEKLPEDALVLGLLTELKLDTSDLYDDFIEDIFDIDVKNGCGYIAGSNERSILMAMYKYCHSAGCRFIRPGECGEYIPYCDLSSHSFKYRKKADYPFRGEVCEGAISYEHMRDTVYWLPKVGMNVYMIEGLVPYTYMHKWYAHIGNRFLQKDVKITDYDMLCDCIERLEKDIKKVGIQFHDLGHGWMFEKFGIHDTTPAEERAAIDALGEKEKQYLALVNGKRDIMHKSLFYTHYCYSNPEARKVLVDFCVEYVQKKPYIDFLHIWLADATNNQCECENCVKMTPSDWYVILLNEIDAALTAIGSKTRLVFALYVDTVRPPEIMRLNNPKRFVILSAIGLHYETGYTKEEFTGEIPPFVRNHFVAERNSVRMLWCKQWKDLCDDIPSIILEYRFYTDQYCDPGHMRISRETYRDMRSLTDVRFDGGCLNDQTHRMYIPTSLPLLLMGDTLFDSQLDFEAYCNDYFTSAFGEDGALVKEYLESLSDLFCPGNLRNCGGNGVEDDGLETKQGLPKSFLNNPEVAEKAVKIPAVLDAFLPTIKKNMALDDPCHRLSWIYLNYHYKMCKSLAEIVTLGALNKIDEATKKLDEFEIMISRFELDIHNGFDLFLLVKSLRAKFNLRMERSF